MVRAYFVKSLLVGHLDILRLNGLSARRIHFGRVVSPNFVTRGSWRSDVIVYGFIAHSRRGLYSST